MNYAPPHKDGEVLIPVPVKVALFGNRAFADDQIKTKTSGWALFHIRLCRNGKCKFGHRDRCAEREDDVKTQENAVYKPSNV